MAHVHLYSAENTPVDGTDVVFQPPVTHNGSTVTKMSFRRYGNGRIAIRLFGIDDDLGGVEVPYATLSHNMPALKLSDPGHFFVLDKYEALADVIATTGHIEKVVSAKPCPFCLTIYAPKYKTIEEAETTEPGSIFVEQHTSGCCSDECWDKATKPDDY